MYGDGERSPIPKTAAFVPANSDGIGTRNYLHVMNWLKVMWLRCVTRRASRGSVILNLGTGHGVSVMEVVKVLEPENLICIPYSFGSIRPGNVATYWDRASLHIQCSDGNRGKPDADARNQLALAVRQSRWICSCVKCAGFAILKVQPGGLLPEPLRPIFFGKQPCNMP